ncbi:MAG: transporter substrate-binding domain-containing protein [Polyangiaceae bacterium]
MLLAARWLSWIVIASACASGRSAPQPARSPTAAATSPTPPTNASRSGDATFRELRVGTSGDYAPFAVTNASGVLSGFDVEIAQQLARDLGMRVRWVTFRWPSLAQDVASDAFDVAMGGITWQPARGVLGYLTRAVARGGPCVLGDAAAVRVGVNRGGVLEAWARGRFGGRELVVVDENRSLPTLLAHHDVGAIVTDSFERKSFARPGWDVSCEPPRLRKVYWVGPAHARELGPRIDAWLRENGAAVRAAQLRWFGEPQRFDATAHLLDLLARRFAFMPIVAALKAQKHLPIEDSAREREILTGMSFNAHRFGLPELPLLDLFTRLIELSKAVQRRQQEPVALDLKVQIRPALDELGERILEALVEARQAHELAGLAPSDLEMLDPWLSREEQQELTVALRALDAAP